MKKNFFTDNTKLFLSISVAIMVVAVAMSLFDFGMNLGIDFTGGSLLSYSVGESYDVKDVEGILASAGYTESQITKAAASDASVALVEAAKQDGTYVEPTSGIEDDGMYDLQIRLNLVDNSEEKVSALTAALTEALGEADEVVELNAEVYATRSVNTDYVGGYMFTFSMDEGYDMSAASTAITAALENSGISLEKVLIEKTTAAVEETEETEEAAAEETTEEAAEETEEETESLTSNIALADGTSVTIEDAVSGDELRVLVNINDQTSLVRKTLETEMTAKYPNFKFVSIEHVSATSGKDLIANAVKSMLIVFVCLLIYIAIRFDVFSGLATLAGLAHDVLIMCAFMVFFRGMFQVNSAFIAALLTIVGYSINNTIVVFDRIREVSKRPGASSRSHKEIVEEAVSNTLSRTINTSLTTLFTLVCLFAFGVDSIREFAFPLIVGMLAGSYSSILLSGQFWAFIMDKRAAKKAA